MVTLSFPTDTDHRTLDVEPGKPLFIIGRNGTGKSALVHSFFGQLSDRAVYIPGSRPNYFENESLSLTPASRRQLTSNLLSWDSSPDTRWRSISGTARNEKAIHDLTAAEAQFKIDAANEIVKDGKESSAILRLQSGISPLDKVNALLAQSNLPISGVMKNAELRACREGNIYSFAKMSDGERAALVLIAEIIAAPPESIFIIDEPELHLHRAIVVPLIRALISERPDSTFLVSTHELDLPAESPQSKIAIVRGCQWRGDSIASWDVDVITEAGQLPESVRIDILGSRRKILFIEGLNNSLDRPLYSLLFPKVSVRSRETCREVERSVSGLRATEDTHNAKAFGLIDNDGMSDEQIKDFEERQVYPLPVYAVESLYYSEELITAVAARQSETFGLDREGLIAEAISKGLASLDANNSIRYLASRVAERQMRDTLLQHMPNRDSLRNETTAEISITIASPFPGELTRLQRLRAEGNLHAIIARYPIRDSGVLDAIVKALRFSTRSDYVRAALTQVGVDQQLQDRLRAKLNPLASHLT